MLSLPLIPRLPADIHGCSLCLGLFVSDNPCNAASTYMNLSLSSSYMLSPWLPAYEFSHLVLFLVGLWALLDKESLEAVVSVSLLTAQS